MLPGSPLVLQNSELACSPLLLTRYLEASLLFPNAPPSGVGGWPVTPPGLSLPLQCPQALAHVFKFRSPDGKKLCTRCVGGRKWRWLFIPATPHFFFFFSEASASELSSPKRQVGRQPSQAKAGVWGGGRER